MSRYSGRKTITCRIDEGLYERFQRLHQSPIYARTQYGSFSDLINQLLLEWLKTNEPNKQPQELDLFPTSTTPDPRIP